MKITILGYGGSGKSTFGSLLSKHYNIDVTHLDQLYFEPNWVEVDKELFEERINKVLSNDSWIFDGNYSRYGKSRITSSDTIFIFNFNRFKCLFNLIKRRIQYNKKVRPSSAEGCYEKLDLTFIKFILIDSRTKSRRQYYKQLSIEYGSKVIIFKNKRQISKYLRQLA